VFQGFFIDAYVDGNDSDFAVFKIEMP
jgi:hypothetical protein